MLCKNCGSNLGPNDVFCNVCGTKVTQDVQNNTPDSATTDNSQAAYNNADTAYNQGQNNPQEAVYSQEPNYSEQPGNSQDTNYSQGTDYSQQPNYSQGADYSQEANYSQTQGQPFMPNNFQPNPVPPVAPKKKGGAGKIVAIIGGAVAVVAVATIGTLAATGRLGNFFHKNFTSPESYFKYVAENTTKESIDSFNSGYSAALDTLDSTSAISGSCSIKLEAGDQLKPLLGLVDDSLKNLDNASLSVNTSLDDSIQNMEIKANINDSEIATINASIDVENEEGYIQIPQLSDSYIDVSDGISELKDQINSSSSEYNEMLSQIQDILPDSDTTSNIINTYVNIALDNVTDVSKSSETIKADGVSQKVTALKTTIDGKYAYNTATDMLKTLKDDEDIKKIIESIDEASYDDFKESIDDAADELKDAKDDFEDVDAEADLTLYVDGKGDIVGTEIVININNQEAVISSVMPKKNSKFGYEMKVEYEDTELFSLTGNGTLKKDIMNGSFSISIGDELLSQVEDYVSDGKDVLKLNVKDFNVADSKEGKFNGTFTFSSDAISEIKGYELNITFTSKDNDSSVALSVSSDGDDYAKLTITAGKGKELKTLKPSGSDTVYSIGNQSDLSDYLGEVDIDTFISNVIDASGVDIEVEDIVDMLDNLFGDDYSYDDDYDYSYDDDDDYSYYDNGYDSTDYDSDYDDSDSDSDYDWTW